MPLKLGLTGGIGSGKTTVAKFMGAFGSVIVDADAISRSMTRTGGLAIAGIAQAFGPDLIQADGAMDRNKMRQLAYADPGLRKRLESIIHPLVSLEAARQAKDATDAGANCIVFDVPLLVESSGWRQKVDHVLVIDCTAECQIKRVMARSDLDRPAIESIMNVQASREQRLHAADSVIFNDRNTLEQLAADVKQCASHLGLSSC